MQVCQAEEILDLWLEGFRLRDSFMIVWWLNYHGWSVHRVRIGTG